MKNMNTRTHKAGWVLVAIVIIVVIALITIRSTPKDEHIVRIGYAPNIGYLPLHVANKEGLFEKEGVKVELKEMQTAQQLYEGLVRGDLDYVPFLSMVPVLNGELVNAGKVKLVSVSDISLENQFDGLLV